jgi:hypothetical protein
VQLGGQTYPATGVVAGRTEWKIVDGSDYKSFYYTGALWRYEEFVSGEGTVYDSTSTSAFRPEQANWSASGLTSFPTPSSTFGIITAGINEPRFDEDPTELTCHGLLMEFPSQANLLLHSSNFKDATSGSYWQNLSATTVTVNQTTSPAGIVDADLLTTSTEPYDCFIRRNSVLAYNTKYAYSIFLKQGPSGHRYVGFYVGSGVSPEQFPFFDFNNPTNVQIPSGTFNGQINETSVKSYPNGWYRVSISVTTPIAEPFSASVGVYISTSNGTLISGNPAGLDVYIWGIQLEAGETTTSYIPTTTTSVIRSADFCSITGAAFTEFYNQSEGTIVGSGLITSSIANPNPEFFRSSDGTIANRIQIGMTNIPAQAIRPFIVSGGTTTYSASSGTATVGVERKIGTAYKTNDAISAFNGTLGTLDTAVTLPTTCNNVTLFSGMVGTISSLRYFKKRLLNEKLQTFTTL